MFKTQFKKIIALSIAVLTISIFCITPARAQSEYYLYLISIYTYYTASFLQTLPAYIQKSLEFTLAWMNPDKSKDSSNFRDQFTKLYDNQDALTNPQNATQQRLLNELFFNMVSKSNDANLIKLVQSLNYTSLLRIPYAPQQPPTPDANKNDPDYTAYSYIRSASGMNISSILPGSPSYNWVTSGSAFTDYANYYNSINSVKTFNGYVLSKLFANYKLKNLLTDTQKQLVKTASSSDWFTKIASEDIGIVLRQILMFNSQSYVLLTRLLETQQDLLTAQTMNNTLLVLLNKSNEGLLLNKATGVTP